MIPGKLGHQAAEKPREGDNDSDEQITLERLSPGKLVIVPAQAGEGAVFRGLGPECLLHPGSGEHWHIPKTRKPRKKLLHTMKNM